MSALEEFKIRSRKTIILPKSGLEVLLRKIPPRNIPDIAIENPPADLKSLTFEQRKSMSKQLFGTLATLIPICVLKPKILCDVSQDPLPEDTVDFDDFEMDDLLFLLSEIFEFSGLGKAAAQERENFPTAPSE